MKKLEGRSIVIAAFCCHTKSTSLFASRDVIGALGLDPNDPDWEKIGFDCAHPVDAAAFERLREKRAEVVRNSEIS